MVGAAAALLAAGCSSTGTTGTRAAGAATPDAASSTSGAPSTSAAATATVYGCDRQPVSRPKTYILSCGDGGMTLNRLIWSAWGTAKAAATGVQTQNGCVPNCAAGSPISDEATVTLSGLTGGHYTKLHIVTAKETADYTIDSMGPIAAR
jgi:hypothetical protein